MRRRVLLLCGGCAAFWLLVGLPFRILDADRDRGNAMLAYAGVAVLLCLVPACGTLLWASRSLRRSPEEQLLAVLGGTGLRLLTVALTGFALSVGVSYFQKYPGFLIWLGAAYLFTLTLEMVLLLTGQAAAQDRPKIT